MEFKEYLEIFKKHLQLFLAVILLFVIGGILFQLFRPLSYRASLNLNVTRSGIQATQDYRYDDFYRLQADERFADTIVRWMQSSRIATDILNDSKIITSGLSQGSLQKYFKAQRMSSQMIVVSYVSKNADTARDLAKSIVKTLNAKTDKLNKSQNEENWFVVVGDDPVIADNVWPWDLVILFSLLVGIFVGFWMILIKHYLSD
jgi:capsular polysaccharide biosynthesis protein